MDAPHHNLLEWLILHNLFCFNEKIQYGAVFQNYEKSTILKVLCIVKLLKLSQRLLIITLFSPKFRELWIGRRIDSFKYFK